MRGGGRQAKLLRYDPMPIIDHGRLLADVNSLCKTFCNAAVKVEVASVDGSTELALVGEESPWTKYTATWNALTDAIDAYLRDRNLQFERGEWSLSWDGGAVAEWILVSISV